VLIVLASLAAAQAGLFSVTNLVTDDQSVNKAQITDAHLKNPWGVSFSPMAGPFWVSDNKTHLATLYTVDPSTNATAKQALEVAIPGDGTVTGQTFNSTAAFNGDNFLFVSEDGTISGWKGPLGMNAEVLQTGQQPNIYKGTTLDTTGGNTYLLSANFGTGNIDVLKESGTPDLTGKFTDPNLPANYAPFDIKNINGTIYVTYAIPNGSGDDSPGPGHGIVDQFDDNGNLLARIASNGNGSPLNSPWGLEIAPKSFGSLAGDLLVGNFGDGTIDAFNLSTKTFDGRLLGLDGKPLVILGLWALTVGNDDVAGSSNKLYFSAGPNDESNGLFGLIELASSSGPTVPEPTTFSLMALGLAGIGACRCASRRRP
jgi:uncharacterized protein (TIGR03118 family)